MTNVRKYVLRKWKTIPGDEFKGAQVSQDGKVRKQISPGEYSRILPLYTTGKGYYGVSLDGKGYLVHRLVVMAWKKPKKTKPFVNHKDGDKKNNWVTNLEWCTQSENQQHSLYVLDNSNGNPKKGVNIYKDGILVMTTRSVSHAAAFVGGAKTNVSKACKGQKPQYKGFTFAYATQPVTQPDLIMYA